MKGNFTNSLLDFQQDVSKCVYIVCHPGAEAGKIVSCSKSYYAMCKRATHILILLEAAFPSGKYAAFLLIFDAILRTNCIRFTFLMSSFTFNLKCSVGSLDTSYG